MNTFADVIDLFLASITDLKYVSYTEEELIQELGLKSKVVIAKARVLTDLYFDVSRNSFSRGLTDEESVIIAHGLIVEWITPKINNFELFETQMSSMDFQQFSNANRLSEMRALRDDSEYYFLHLVSQYDLSNFNPYEDGVGQ